MENSRDGQSRTATTARSFPQINYHAMVGDMVEYPTPAFALAKIKAGEYVELAYWLVRWKSQAFKAAKALPSNTLNLVGSFTGGDVSFKPAATGKPIKNIPRDSELTWTEMLTASGLYCDSFIKEAKWPQEHVLLLQTMYVNLQDCKLFTEWPNGEKVILQYAESVREQWLTYMRGDSSRAFNVSIINGQRLRDIRTDIEQKETKLRIR